jgi:GNAT superfamily N-acetyltransferase
VAALTIVDVTDAASFALIPACADPGFDHRSCDYWEDPDRGSRAARASWLEARSPATPAAPAAPAGNPFLDDLATLRGGAGAANPFALDEDDEVDNPFAPRRTPKPTVGSEAPRKLQLLGRGLAVFGTYAKVLLEGDTPAAWCQFGPLTAYPRAQRVRDLYPQLPESPLPAVITCIATTAEARGRGHGLALVRAVCDDLADRGFAAVEAYPEAGAPADATSAATPGFWIAAGFVLAVDDDRFPVVRREL